jgi:NAD-dependent dihydropyrimidine dehydrogenase PreA subunit
MQARRGWCARSRAGLPLRIYRANLWCRFCLSYRGPLELVRRIALLRGFKTSAGNNCNACLQVCEMGTRPDETGCNNCGDCLGSCPVDAIKFGRKRV